MTPLQRLETADQWLDYAHDMDELMREVGPHHQMFAAMAKYRNLALDVAVVIQLECEQ